MNLFALRFCDDHYRQRPLRSLLRLSVSCAMLAGMVFVATTSAASAVINTTVEKTNESLTVTTPAGAWAKLKVSSIDPSEYTIETTDAAKTLFTGTGDCKPASGPSTDLSTVSCTVKPNTSAIKTIIIHSNDKNDDITVDLPSRTFPAYDSA